MSNVKVTAPSWCYCSKYRFSICLQSCDLSAVCTCKVLSRALVVAEKRTSEMVQLDDELKEEKTSSGCRAVFRIVQKPPRTWFAEFSTKYGAVFEKEQYNLVLLSPVVAFGISLQYSTFHLNRKTDVWGRCPRRNSQSRSSNPTLGNLPDKITTQMSSQALTVQCLSAGSSCSTTFCHMLDKDFSWFFHWCKSQRKR